MSTVLYREHAVHRLGFSLAIHLGPVVHHGIELRLWEHSAMTRVDILFELRQAEFTNRILGDWASEA